ncbi:MAG: FadR/GntR family transcriptional regulator [Anaerorhabdus sp.]
MVDKSLGKIVKINIAKQVSKAIEEKIFSRQWPIGMKIPSENVLCDTLNVSRVSVRSAIQELIGLGLLESKQGEGTFVKEVSIHEYFSRISPLIFHQGNIKESAEYRFAIESSCAKFAIDNYNEKDINELEKLCLASEKKYNDGNLNDYINADYLFHRHLCKMSNNKILLTMFDAFSLSFFNTSEENLKIVTSPSSRKELSHHIQLVNAIKEKNYAEAYKICYKLILFKDDT